MDFVYDFKEDDFLKQLTVNCYQPIHTRQNTLDGFEVAHTSRANVRQDIH